MRSIRGIFAAASMALLAGTSISQTAEARTKAGVLTCEVESGVAFIVSSPRDLHCVFYGQDGRHEAYGGRVQEAGIDIGVSGRGVISWTVVSETNRLERGALRGSYSGVEAGAAIGVGGTGRVLVGGNRQSISLQPLSVEARSGLNLALGVASMNIYPLFTASSRPNRAPAPAVGHDEETVPHHRVVPHYGCGSYTHLQEFQTLSGLAHACGVSLEALLQANPQITNVRNISAGALIHIPTHVSHTGDSPCGTRTILNEDEALDHAAWRCGVTLHALLTANPEVRDLDAVRAGLVLKIPERREANAAPPVRYVTSEREADEPEQSGINLDRLSTAEQIGAGRRQDRIDVPRHSRELARLEVRCEEAAADKYGIDIRRIGIDQSRPAGSNSYSVSLNADGEEAVCLIDRSGNILFLSEPGGPQEGVHARIARSAITDVQSRLTQDETLEQLAISETGETRRSGLIQGYKSAVYMFDGYAGEVLDISFDTDSNSAYFNVVSADNPDGAAIYIGSTDDDKQTRLTIPSDGLYLIRPYLVRAAARRNEKANYTVSVSIARMGEAQQSGTTRAADPADDGGGAMAGSSDDAGTSSGAQQLSSDVSQVAIDACVAEVKNQTNEPNVSVTSTEFSQANSLVMVAVGANNAPWKCLVSNDGQSAEVTFMGTDGDSVEQPQQPAASYSDVSQASIDACISAVRSQTNEGNLAVLSTEFSQTNSLVMIGVGADRAPWKCLVSNDGQTADVSFAGDEGAQ